MYSVAQIARAPSAVKRSFSSSTLGRVPRAADTRLAWLRVALFCALALRPAAAHAACGELDCGPHGSCDATSLLARCTCDAGYFSLRVKMGESSLGAYCVPEPAPPDVGGCDVCRCEPHGTCMLTPDTDAGGATCRCDPGFLYDSLQGCIDDPADGSESICDGVRCGEGNYCLPTPQGPTCRCLRGGNVALGSADDDAFGPVCTTPPDPATACGPDACGPYGRCVISQAARCDCDDGAEIQTLTASDGKQRPYCVDPSRPWPAHLPAAEGVRQQPAAGVDPDDAGSDAGAAPDPDAGSGTHRPGAVAGHAGCQCRATSNDRSARTGWLLLLTALVAFAAPLRSARRRIARGSFER